MDKQQLIEALFYIGILMTIWGIAFMPLNPIMLFIVALTGIGFMTLPFVMEK